MKTTTAVLITLIVMGLIAMPSFSAFGKQSVPDKQIKEESIPPKNNTG